MQYLDFIQQKITIQTDLQPILVRYNFLGKKIVFTNGCFDLLHRGHVEYLAKAASLGDIMIVGLNTDASVRKLKGAERPLQDEYTRALVLSALTFVSHVVLFDEDTPYELIKLIQPDLLVKGADYQPETIVGYDIVMAKGGRVATIDLTDGFSTTKIVGKMKKGE
ncbi:MAG: hypothetical protein RIS47_781 [Bacteroidota bacterium]|jgi:rfaE bifunctional protein nucleotidyltransferase chain/domain